MEARKGGLGCLENSEGVKAVGVRVSPPPPWRVLIVGTSRLFAKQPLDRAIGSIPILSAKYLRMKYIRILQINKFVV